MAPGLIEKTLPYINGNSKHSTGRPREVWGTPLPTRKPSPHDDVHFDSGLKPRAHRMASNSSASKILFLNVQILDSTGAQPYPGDVLIQGERIRHVGTVPGVERLRVDPSVKVIQGKGRTLMSGLGDAHTHLTWIGGGLDTLGDLGIEEHTLCTARSAMMYLDSGYTMCFGAASAKDRLDSVVRDAINQRILPGPRYLANAREIARRGGELAADITAFADGPLEMREIIRSHAKIGVDQIKLSMSGEDMLETRPANDCYFTDEETAACVDEAHRLGLRVCSHARSRDSIAQCIKHGVDVIYHASYMDEATMDALEKNKHQHVVAPGLNWLYATLYDATPFGISYSQAEKTGYKKELEAAIKGCKEMHERGITVLPGGDYGFAWTPHGTYARDLEHFVKLLDYTPMETIIAATAGVAKLFMQEHELGKIQPGYYADCILVDGNPLKDIAILQDHDRLNIIMINGRIHKASPRDFARQSTNVPAIEETVPQKNHSSNYVTYMVDQNKLRVGHLHLDTSRVTPLVMSSGAPVTSLYQVIELQNEVTPVGEPIPLDEVRVLPPFSDRDILAVGKDYAEHAAEFNKSGYDSSDKIDQPSHPAIFTKRSTSIVASGEEIYPHTNFTESLDYEGEIGVIIGKSGYRISKEEAMDYVWGYTIINDITARERQRDHKQFYIGKSADTFCPMGPIAVPADYLPKKLRVQTSVNGDKRQDGTTDDLTFSIPTLIKTLSEGSTLRAGDVIATGTPAGVRFGQDSAQFLKVGDQVEVEVTGLGRLQNVVGTPSEKPNNDQIPSKSHLPDLNLETTAGGLGLTCIGGKQMNVKRIGNGPETAIFVHGLGGTSEYFTPILKSGDFESRFTSYVYDLEGHGLTPTNIASRVSIASYAADLANIINFTNTTTPITLIAHSMGCLIAITYALRDPSRVKNLILMGPVPAPLPPPARQALTARANAVRSKGLLGSGTADAVSDAGTSSATKMFQPVAYTAVRSSLLNTNPEGYAKACMALVEAQRLDIENLTVPVLVMTGDEDKTAPVQAVTAAVHERLPDSRLEVLRCTGHWHVYENPEGISKVIRSFLA